MAVQIPWRAVLVALALVTSALPVQAMAGGMVPTRNKASEPAPAKPGDTSIPVGNPPGDTSIPAAKTPPGITVADDPKGGKAATFKGGYVKTWPGGASHTSLEGDVYIVRPPKSDGGETSIRIGTDKRVDLNKDGSVRVSVPGPGGRPGVVTIGPDGRVTISGGLTTGREGPLFTEVELGAKAGLTAYDDNTFRIHFPDGTTVTKRLDGSVRVGTEKARIDLNTDGSVYVSFHSPGGPYIKAAGDGSIGIGFEIPEVVSDPSGGKPGGSAKPSDPTADERAAAQRVVADEIKRLEAKINKEKDPKEKDRLQGQLNELKKYTTVEPAPPDKRGAGGGKWGKEPPAQSSPGETPRDPGKQQAPPVPRPPESAKEQGTSHPQAPDSGPPGPTVTIRQASGATDSVVKNDPFVVVVTLPLPPAGTKPPDEIEVSVTTPTGREKTLTLHRTPEEGSTTYVSEPTTIVIYGGRAYLPWNASIKNGDSISISYQGAKVDVKVYDSKPDQGIARNAETLSRLRDQANAVFERAHKGLQAVEKALTGTTDPEIRKELEQARTKFQEAKAIAQGKLKLITEAREVLAHRPPETGPLSYDKLRQLAAGNAYLAAIQAYGAFDDRAVHQIFIAGWPDKVRDMLTDIHLQFATDFALGLYQAVASLSLAGPAWQLATGTDIFERDASRLDAAADLLKAFVLMKALSSLARGTIPFEETEIVLPGSRPGVSTGQRPGATGVKPPTGPPEITARPTAPTVRVPARGPASAEPPATVRAGAGRPPEPSLNIEGKPGPGLTKAHLEAIQRLADQTGERIVVFGSRQTGVSAHTGQPFTETSDIDIGVIGGPKNLSNVLRANPEEVIGWKTDLAGLWPTAPEAMQKVGGIVISPRVKPIAPDQPGPAPRAAAPPEPPRTPVGAGPTGTEVIPRPAAPEGVLPKDLDPALRTTLYEDLKRAWGAEDAKRLATEMRNAQGAGVDPKVIEAIVRGGGEPDEVASALAEARLSRVGEITPDLSKAERDLIGLVVRVRTGNLTEEDIASLRTLAPDVVQRMTARYVRGGGDDAEPVLDEEDAAVLADAMERARAGSLSAAAAGGGENAPAVSGRPRPPGRTPGVIGAPAGTTAPADKSRSDRSESRAQSDRGERQSDRGETPREAAPQSTASPSARDAAPAPDKSPAPARAPNPAAITERNRRIAQLVRDLKNERDTAKHATLDRELQKAVEEKARLEFGPAVQQSDARTAPVPAPR